MRTSFFSLFGSLLLLAGCSSSPPSQLDHLASAGPGANDTRGPVLQLTHFEAPVFTVGEPVDGIEGWLGFFAPQASIVSDTQPSTGRACLRMLGSDLEFNEDFEAFHAFAGAELMYDPVAMGRPVVHCGADVRLDGPDTGDGPEADLLSANLVLLNTLNQVIGGYFVSSNGIIYAFARGGQAYLFPTPQTAGQYARLELDVDFTAKLIHCSINGVHVGTMILDPNNTLRTKELWTFGVEVVGIADPDLLDPADYTARFDNIMVIARPGNAGN